MQRCTPMTAQRMELAATTEIRVEEEAAEVGARSKVLRGALFS
jgi:hypothetical protein